MAFRGQDNLSQAKVLVIGAGGLGCPILQYIAAAGIATIGVVDDDLVSLHNLHRQVLYNVNDIGFSKALVAKKKLEEVNPDINVIAYNERLNVCNALDILGKYDIVADGTDNFATRYLINDACVLLGKPLVYGAVSRFEGQVAVFNCRQPNGDLVTLPDVSDPPKNGDVLNCEEGGILGVLPGIIGTMMANEIIKLITGLGTPLINQMVTYNALDRQVFELALSVNEQKKILGPKDSDAFRAMNYEWLCTSPAALQFEIEPADLDALIHTGSVKFIDVRELEEAASGQSFKSDLLPWRSLS